MFLLADHTAAHSMIGIVYASGLPVAVYLMVFADLNTCHGKIPEKSLNI